MKCVLLLTRTMLVLTIMISTLFIAIAVMVIVGIMKADIKTLASLIESTGTITHRFQDKSHHENIRTKHACNMTSDSGKYCNAKEHCTCRMPSLAIFKTDTTIVTTIMITAITIVTTILVSERDRERERERE